MTILEASGGHLLAMSCSVLSMSELLWSNWWCLSICAEARVSPQIAQNSCGYVLSFAKDTASCETEGSDQNYCTKITNASSPSSLAGRNRGRNTAFAFPAETRKTRKNIRWLSAALKSTCLFIKRLQHFLKRIALTWRWARGHWVSLATENSSARSGRSWYWLKQHACAKPLLKSGIVRPRVPQELEPPHTWTHNYSALR